MADTLLVVDDDTSLLADIGDHLERAGYVVLREASGEGAIVTCRRERPDVVLLDLRLPDENGMAVLGRLHGQRAAVVLLIEPGDDEVAVQAMQLGAEGVLTKPGDLGHLADRIPCALWKVGFPRGKPR